MCSGGCRFADSAKAKIDNGNFLDATYIWADMEEAVLDLTDNVVCATTWQEIVKS